jgi:hypothetical protein
MSFIHHLFVGDFERDENGIRFGRPGPTEPYRPVVAQPLTQDVVAAVVREVTGRAREAIPTEWSSWLDDGYLVSDKYTRNAEEIDFISKLVERTGYSLYDRAAHTEISLSDWLSVAHGTAGHPG